MDIESVGVIVGRFQVASLTEGHGNLIREVSNRHQNVVVMVGCHPVPGTAENPLDYQSRAAMLTEFNPKMMVLPIFDCPTDKEWSANLDRALHGIFPTSTALLYGSRDSFISHYSGMYPTKVLDELSDQSGTTHRRVVARDPLRCTQSRRGAIFNAINRYPCVYPVVDIIVCHLNRSILLGRRNSDMGLWRFPGGFVDKRDNNLEAAASRELKEETGVIAPPEKMVYLGSFKPDDWRYKNKRDSITSSVFVCHVDSKEALASDDLDQLMWFDIDNIFPATLVDAHQPIYRMMDRFVRKVRL